MTVIPEGRVIKAILSQKYQDIILRSLQSLTVTLTFHKQKIQYILLLNAT